jgi:hypothetical protein
MLSYADLELSLHRADASAYHVDFRFSQPNSDADILLGRSTGSGGDQVQAALDLPKLAGLLYDPPEYAAELTHADLP